MDLQNPCGKSHPEQMCMNKPRMYICKKLGLSEGPYNSHLWLQDSGLLGFGTWDWLRAPKFHRAGVHVMPWNP